MPAVSVKIDGKKLKKEFETRNLTVPAVAERVGVHPATIHKILRKCSMTKVVCKSLESAYNINMDNIIIADEDVDVENNVEDCVIGCGECYEKLNSISASIDSINSVVQLFPSSEEVEAKLHKIIYSAVYEAVKKAWAE